MLPTETTILRELLAAESGFVSGTRLAKSLGISRVAVWMQLQKLAKQGFVFEAVRSRGYKISGFPRQLHPALVQAYLTRRSRPPRILCLETVDSTNSEAERQLAGNCRVPLVILAAAQTEGRGRRGRSWHSPAEGNLYASFVFRPELEPGRMQDFTLWMGLNICELVANFCKIKPGLKWPNDLFAEGRKAGGMLTEARIDADQIRELVFGLGLNLNSPSANFPREIQPSAVSLSEAANRPIDLNRFAAALIGRVMAAFNQFVDGGYREKFEELWPRYDILRGRRIAVVQGTRTIRGIATGIDKEGSLVLRLDSGATERFRAGEVTIEKETLPRG